MSATTRRAGSLGFSLVELLVSVGLVGCILLSVMPVAMQVIHESARASRHADQAAMRWETVRRFRRDASLAASAKLLRSASGGARGVVLLDEWGTVTWAEREGLLHRAASPGPVMQGATLRASFDLESRNGRTFLAYTFEDEAGELSGRVLLGSAP